ncbi:glycoside hydrolase domain-containing protein [Streptomyces sp. NPDC048550]|uniref:glycoside hydrolase domain-containing protein n=1 Tax=Streptomyces sp. NPDC048550 TaxID=3155739 RepID=UPI00343B1DEE
MVRGSSGKLIHSPGSPGRRAPHLLPQVGVDPSRHGLWHRRSEAPGGIHVRAPPITARPRPDLDSRRCDARRDGSGQRELYGGAAVYIGGAEPRLCSAATTTASWVKSVDAAGWKLVPLYVGAQPPCQTGRDPERFTAADAAAVGTANGSDAVAKASALGISRGSPA